MPIEPATLAAASRGHVIAAAGCGKTRMIADAVAAQHSGRQLILTHTHAGVRSIINHLRRLDVPRERFRVETIAGFALKYAASYPGVSGVRSDHPSGEEWREVYEAASKVLRTRAVGLVLRHSYAGVYVDEYQDCSGAQHGLVLRIAELLPCRILGDPLQGIFRIGSEALVDWATDVEREFPRLDELTQGWRWAEANPDLGAWLLEVRTKLLEGRSVDLRNAPLTLRPLSPPGAEVALCFQVGRMCQGSIVAINQWAPQCHALSKKLGGMFTSMEEIESADLLDWADVLERSRGAERALEVVKFACVCMTRVSTVLARVIEQLESGHVPVPLRAKKTRRILEALAEVASSDAFGPACVALQMIAEVPQRVLYRRELWNAMIRAISLRCARETGSLRDAAWDVRNKDRRIGRLVERRTVSRTLLVKGLEFDHAVVINPTGYDAENFYVAATRGARSLAVVSDIPVLTLPLPVWRP